MRSGKRFLAGATGLALALSLAACSSPPPSGFDVSLDDANKYCDFEGVQKSPASIPSQTVVVIAPTDNFVDFESIITASETKIKAALGGSLPDSKLRSAVGSEFSVILADGRPRMLAKRSVQPLTQDPSAYDLHGAIDSTFGVFKLANICAAGGYKRPDDQVTTSPGSDLLQALSIASDQLTVQGPKKIFIIGNGIQTEGAIQMQEKGAFPKSESSARLLALGLKGIGEIPDLNGAEVSWYGLGQVDGQKQELSEKAKTSLESFWRQVITLGHGTIGTICDQCGAGKPHVHAIVVPKIEVATCKLVRLYEEDGVEFKPDSDTFVNLEKARKAAKQMSLQFKGKGCDEMSITGFAAAGVDKATYDAKKTQIDKTNKTLTARRAAAFARLVRAAGFSGAISSAGGGTCGTEWSASGAVDLELQRLCRRVEVSN